MSYKAQMWLINLQSKFLSIGGTRCDWQTRGVLQRDHVIAMNHIPCGKETKRDLGENTLDRESDFSCKVYMNGKIAGDLEILHRMGEFTEREISAGADAADSKSLLMVPSA
jgi:hypothetical protein